MEPLKCDVLILIPKRDELRSAAPVFNLDPDSADLMVGDTYESWGVIVADLHVRLVLADSQGNANVALATSAAISELDPAVVFCIGTAAGRKDRTSFMDVVLATGVLDANEWRTKPGRFESQWDAMFSPTRDVESDIDRFIKTKSWQADAEQLLARGLEGVGAEVDPDVVEDWPRVKDAWTVTTGFLHEDPAFLDEVWRLHARLRAIDMETAGFVAACVQLAHPRAWIVVRAISDFGTEDSKRDDARPAAGVAAAAIAHCFIATGLQRAHPLRIGAPPAAASVLSDQNFFAQLSMSDFLAKEIPRQFGIPFDEGTVSRDLTISDLAALCGGEAAIPTLNDLRETYFSTKYVDYDDEADVRLLTGSAWADEVLSVYEYLGISLPQADVLYVGVGTGRDLRLVCPEFKTLTGVDLSSAMLEQAAGVEPKLKRIRDQAEALSFIPGESADLYLSLRTFQSSLFDVPSALRQAYRVLRPNGGLVVSIPGGFLDRSGDDIRYVPGLLVPGSGNAVDRTLPRRHADEILTHMERMTFSQVGFHRREGDIYVYGRKT